MSLFDSASLVVTPNGYKEDKLYSIKPTDGSGDLVVTRATTATRVNSDGLIEQVPYNFITYSEQFNNADWTKVNATITANSVTAPNGTLTADTITDNSTNGLHVAVKYSTWMAITQTASVYAKAGTSSKIFIGNLSQGRGSYFDLSTQTVVNSSLFSGTIESVGDGWYRLTATHTSGTDNQTFGIGLFTGTSTTSYVGSGQTAYIWGAQLVSGSSAKEYFPTTDRLDIPRLDYTNSSCPSILVEPQRTNLQRASEDLSNTSFWSYGATSISTNQTTSPDGNNTADKLVENNTNARHELYTSVLTYNGLVNVSFFAKASERRYLACFIAGDPSKGGAIFDLQSGVVSLTSGGTNASIQDYGNGWYRCSFTSTYVGTSSLYLCLRTNASVVDVQTYAGDGTSGLYIWGMQQETSSNYPTSYIPTVASTVTRNADLISKTGISSLIGQTEGTIFFDFKLNGPRSSSVIFWLTDGSSSNAIIAQYTSGGVLQIVLNSGGVTQVNIVGSASASGTYKLAIAYKLNDVIVYLNGVSVGLDTSATMPVSMSRIDIGQSSSSTAQLGGSINSAILWKERLTNEQLAQLTTI